MGTARSRLTDAMSDLPAFIDAHPRDGGPGARGGFDGHAFALALDMEPEDPEEPAQPRGPGGLLVSELLTDTRDIADSIPLDALVVDAAHLDAVRQQRNLAEPLKSALMGACA